MDTDGRPLKDAEDPVRAKRQTNFADYRRTDVNGHYTAALPKGIYKMSLTTKGTPKTSITVKATGANSRIDFDLRPFGGETKPPTGPLGRSRNQSSSII
jgi:hypothetical protein